MAERPLPGRIEPFEVTVEAGDAQKIERQREKAIQYLFGAPPLDELADLTADGAEHVEQLGIRLADLAAEELHHADQIVSDRNRKAERGVQAFPRSDGRAWKIRIVHDVVDEFRPTARPDAAGQSDTLLERHRAARCFELVEGRRGRTPDFHASQAICVSIDLP